MKNIKLVADVHTKVCQCLKCQNKPVTVKVVAITPARQNIVLARCQCGQTFYAWENNIRRGNTKSCGCLNTSKPTNNKAVFSLKSGWADRTYWKWLDKKPLTNTKTLVRLKP